MTQTSKKEVSMTITGVPYETNAGLKYLASMNQLSKERFIARDLTEYIDKNLSPVLID